MQRARGIYWVGGAVLLFLVGCAVPDYLGLSVFPMGPGQDRVVSVSLEAESASIQAILRELEIQAVVSQNADEVQIAYSTKSGANFVLVLTRVKTIKGEQTRIHIKGDTGSSDPTHVRVMARLDGKSSQ